MPWVRVAKTAEVPSDGIRTFAVKGRKVALARIGAEFFAIDDRCSHAACSLGTGRVEEKEVECSCHGARFDLATGEVRALPATTPIPVYPVEVRGDEVWVEL